MFQLNSIQGKKKALIAIMLVLGVALLINAFSISYTDTAIAWTWDGDDCPGCDDGDDDWDDGGGGDWCPSGCSDQCSYYGQRTCVDSTHYKTCGNYDCDTCLEWSGSNYCGAGKICSGGQCITSCTTHNYKQCYDNDVYWYDSCNVREDKSNECGADAWTNNYQCSGNWTQRQKTLKGCSGSSCYENTQWINQTDCNAQGKTCSGGSCVYSNLNVSCSALPNPADISETVVFSAYPSGGSGTYSYIWSNACYGYSQTCSKSFLQSGNYPANITVYSSGQTASASCSVQINQPQCQCSSWSAWQNQGCGQGSCASTQMYQTRSRDCTPDGCNTESESRCVSDQSCTPSCTNECSYQGQTTCQDSGSNKTCGYYDSDSCLEWSSSQSCGTDGCTGTTYRDYHCSGGTCSYSDQTCSTQCFYCGDNICNSSCGENTSNCSQDCGQDCSNECSYSGQRRCYNSTSNQTCGDYDSDSCLEWSNPDSCQGSTGCGYGKCDNDERPDWRCSGGYCEYDCDYSSSCDYDDNDYKRCYNNDVYWYDSNNHRQDKYDECGSDSCGSWENYCSGDKVYKKRTCYDRGCSNAKCVTDKDIERKYVKTCDDKCDDGKCVEERECTSGPCCDGYNYKDENTACNSDRQVQYGCPWGTTCGADSGTRSRIRYQYCSGDDNDCDGDWGSWYNWSSWRVADYCTNSETCSYGDATCNYNSTCQTTPIYTNYKQCYDNDVYWFRSDGTQLSKYMECDDANSCTLDNCSGDRCINDLKCDGSTCAKGSQEYCSNCESCGDGICNCDETFCECGVDCTLPSADGLAISSLVRIKGADTSWKKDLEVAPGDELSFLIVVATAGNETITDLTLENTLPNDIEYLGNLKINDSISGANILAGINLGALSANESKIITFDAKVSGASDFADGSTYLNNLSTVRYDTGKTEYASVGIEVVKDGLGTAAAGNIFSQIVGIIGTLAFWLVMLFLVILAIILSLVGFYFLRKKREVRIV